MILHNIPRTLAFVLGLLFLGTGQLPGYGQAPPPVKLPTTAINPRDGAELILVPAGNFLMGSADTDTNARGEEKPQHTVYLDAYYIYKNDVTVAQYRKFCAATGRKMPGEPVGGWKDDHPIRNMPWTDADAYAQWAGAALPTEAQWEKAARGTDSRLYPWGNDWDATKCQCSKVTLGDAKDTAPVGNFPAGASPYGVLDMTGNVDQWCADWYGADVYARDGQRNPSGPAEGKWRVVRGGAWLDNAPRAFRCANRHCTDPNQHSGRTGFRCVLTVTAVLSPAAPVTVAPVETIDTTAKLHVTTTPAGATVFLDGTKLDATSNCTVAVPLGVEKTKTVELGLALNGYNDEVNKLTLERGKTFSVTVTLHPKATPVAIPDAPAKTAAPGTPTEKPGIPAGNTPAAPTTNTASPGSATVLDDYMTPVTTNAEEINAKLKGVKDSLFFLDAIPCDGRIAVKYDDFLLPNGPYAKIACTWTKLTSSKGANLLRQPTPKDLQFAKSNPSELYICSVDDENVRTAEAVGRVQLQIPTKFARVTFTANDVDATRQDGPLTVTMTGCEPPNALRFSLPATLKPEEVFALARDAAGKRLTFASIRRWIARDGVPNLAFDVNGLVAKVDVIMPTEYVSNTFDVHPINEDNREAQSVGLISTRYVPPVAAVKEAVFDAATLKAAVSVAARRYEQQSNYNVPSIALKLPPVLNTMFAQVDAGIPELTDANEKSLKYDKFQVFDAEAFIDDILLLETKAPFAFATGSLHLRYPAKLTLVTLTTAKPDAGEFHARFNGATVSVSADPAGDEENALTLPPGYAGLRAFDASGRQIRTINPVGTERINDVHYTTYAFWGKSTEVRIVVVDKWISLDLPYHLPPAPKLPGGEDE